MPDRVVRLDRAPGALDVVSHGKCGPGRRPFLTAQQVAQVARTVRGTPEVVVKASGGARDVGGAQAHFDYIDRHGRLGIETDEGLQLSGKAAAAQLVDEWNLELSRGQYRPADQGRERRPKLVHNIVLSMPGRTPPEAVLEAARTFAREHFALQHRYAMVLHTDQAHPHVHLVVKAEHEYEPGRRLHITKPMLRQWRQDFAAALREQGVAANATPAVLRGRPREQRRDAIHQRLEAVARYQALPEKDRARRQPPRGSRFMRAKVEAVARDLQAGRTGKEAGREQLLRTRDAVVAGWLRTAQVLREQGEEALAREVEQFARSLPPVRTERERIAAGLMAQVQALRRQAARERPPLARDGPG